MGFFLGFCSILSFGPYFFVSLIWQPPCVYFCVLGRAALTPCVSAPVKLCTVKPQVFTRAVQPTSLLSGSVGGRGVGEETMVLPGYCSLARHLPHFQSLHPSPYATSTPLAAAPVVVPRVGRLAYVLELCGPFKWILLKDQQFILLPQPPLDFKARTYETLFPSTGTLGCMVWPGAGIIHSQGILPIFLSII